MAATETQRLFRQRITPAQQIIVTKENALFKLQAVPGVIACKAWGSAAISHGMRRKLNLSTPFHKILLRSICVLQDIYKALIKAGLVQR